MDSRTEDSIINFANFPWKMPPTLSSEAALSRTREKLAKLVTKCGLFDSYTLDAFANTREENGTYRIDAGDSLLINTVKCIINILYCLEIMKPSLYDPFTSYLQSDTWLVGSIHYFSFLSNYTYQRTRIMKEFKFYVRFLQYYLDQLEKNDKIIKIFNNELITAAITLGKELKEKTQPFTDAVPISQILLSEYNEQQNVEDKDDKTSHTIADICDVIDACKNKITAFITSNDASIVANPESGLFAEDSTEHATIKNLLHAVNTLTRFKKALKKVDRVINYYELNLLEVCTELGNVIKELQKINIKSIKKIYLTEFLVLLQTIIKKTEPIFREIGRLLDLAELNLGINSGLIHTQFATVLYNYQAFANTLKTPLNEVYPYWKDRLTLQEAELIRKQDLKKQVIAARKIISKIQINDKTSLHDLLVARSAARQISTPNMYYYEKEINLLIASKTGLGKLNDEIEATENLARLSTSSKQENALLKLQSLYQLRKALESKLKKVETTHDLTAEPFSYDAKTQTLVPRPFSNSWLTTYTSNPELNIQEPTAATLQTADEFITGLNHDCERLYNQIICAENMLIAKQVVADAHLDIDKVIINNLRKKLLLHTFLSLFLLSIEELDAFLNELRSLHSVATAAYEKIIQLMLNEKRYGFDFFFHDKTDALLACYNNFAEERYKLIRFCNSFFIEPQHESKIVESKEPPAQEKDAIETPTQILTKINDKFKGTIVLNSAASRKKILSLLTQFLSAEEYDKLNESLMVNGIYTINISDPILIKTIKSLLNSLLRFEEVLIQVQPHLRNIAAGKGHASFAIYGLPATHAAFLAFKLDINDFFYYLSLLNTAFPLLAEVYKLPVFGKILNLASKAFNVGKNIFFTAEMAELLNMDHVSNINQGLVKLDEMAQASEDSKLDLVFSPIETVTTGLDKIIGKFYGIKRSKNSFQATDANDDENLKDLLTIANTLSKTSKTLQKLVSIADKKAVGDFLIVAANTFDIYKKIKHLYNNRIFEIKNILKDLLEHIHPLLIELAAHIEMMEIKFGVPSGSLASRMKIICEQFEKIAEKFNVKFISYYPYACEKIDVVTREMQTLRKQYAMFLELEDMLTENRFNESLIISSFSLKNLVFMRDALNQLPTSLTFKLLREINITIERRTGLQEVQEQIKTSKKTLRNLNNDISKLKKQLADLTSQQTVFTHQIKFINQCLDKLDNIKFLSSEEVAFLYHLYKCNPANDSQPFAYFLHLLLTDTEYFRAELILQKYAYKRDLAPIEDAMTNISNQVEKKIAFAATIQAELLKSEQIQAAFVKRIAEVNQLVGPTEFKYTNGITYDNDYVPYTGGPIPFDTTLIPVVADYRKVVTEKLRLMNEKHNSMLSAQHDHVLAMFTKHKQVFSDAEKKLTLKEGMLTDIVPSKITDIKKDTLLAHDLMHTRGFFFQYLQHWLGSIPVYYANILTTPENMLTLSKEILSEAAKHTSDFGMYVRNLFSKRTMNDNFYLIAQYWCEKLKASKLALTASPAKSPLASQTIFQLEEKKDEEQSNNEDKTLPTLKKA